MITNSLYQKDIQYISGLPLPWDKLKNKAILITGATGLIGTCLIDALMAKNQDGLQCKIYALGRSEEKAKSRFCAYWDSPFFTFLSYDVRTPIAEEMVDEVHYIVHLASNTHPVQYATDPIGTITTNIIGTDNLLKFATKKKSIRCMLASSNEIYGENRGDVEFFSEDYCGYIDCNTLRAGYTESKRCSEALCQAYIEKEKLDVVIARLTRSYGPTMQLSDTKAISQFIKKGINGEDIVLKSEGTQYFSYTYVADAVSGLLYILLNGHCGEAYNIADEKSDIRLKDLAGLIALKAGKKVIFEIPEEAEAKGYSKATKARLSSDKIKQLGWSAKDTIESGIGKTMKILKERDKAV